VPALVPERYDLQTNQWMLLAADTIIRNCGFYVLFLVTNERVPSEGAWVKVE
jgi:hypothetical protein